jgi:integrase
VCCDRASARAPARRRETGSVPSTSPPASRAPFARCGQRLVIERAHAVFRGPRGGELSRADVSRELHKHALEDAGLGRSLRLHDLRHTAAASWLAAGLPLIYVQRQLGHASITTTEQVYGHLEDSFLRGAADRVERLIWTPPDG